MARGGFAAFVIYGLGIGLTYCSQLLIARFVGVDTYGVYAYAFAWMSVLAYFSALGFDVALLRFVPAYEAERAWPLCRGVIQYAQRRALVVGISVVVIGIGVVLLRDLPVQIRNTFVIGLLVVPVWALLWIKCSVVRSFGGVVLAVGPDRVVRDGLLVAVVAFASIYLGWNLDAAMVMIATLATSVVGLVLASAAIRWLYPRVLRNIQPIYDGPTWRKAALPLVIIGATEAMMNRTGVLLLGWAGDTKAAGIYSLAFNVAFVVALPRIAVNTLFAPTVSSLFARDERAMLQHLIKTAASWTLAASSCIAVVLFVFAEQLFAWFGAGYEAGVPALRILLVAQVLVAGAGSQLYVMTMTAHERGAATLLVSCAALNAVFSVALIHWFGLDGAAVATAATLVLWNMAMALFLWQRLNLMPGVLAFVRTPLAKLLRVITGR